MEAGFFQEKSLMFSFLSDNKVNGKWFVLNSCFELNPILHSIFHFIFILLGQFWNRFKMQMHITNPQVLILVKKCHPISSWECGFSLLIMLLLLAHFTRNVLEMVSKLVYLWMLIGVRAVNTFSRLCLTQHSLQATKAVIQFMVPCIKSSQNKNNSFIPRVCHF